MAGLRWACAVVVAVAAWSHSASPAQVRGPETAVRTPPAAAPQQAPGGQTPEQRPASPAPEIKIAAVVNDEVISVFDLVSRMRLVMNSSNIPDSPETRQRIGTQVLRGLIDEKLELQEAKRKSITASDSEINNALLLIEKQNNMKPGQLNEFMKARGIDRGGLVDQVTASIVWAKLVRRMAAQTVDINDEEIEENLKRVKEHAGEPQSHVAEIFLAVDNPAQDEEVRRLAERLTQQMKQGSRFSAVAQQFSQSATAAVGGDIGWVRPDQLSPELGKAVAALPVGALSPPIRAGGGYYLVLVVDRRSGGSGGGDTIYDIVQVVFALPAGASEAARRGA